MSKSTIEKNLKKNTTHTHIHMHTHVGFPGGSVVKNLPVNAGDWGSISGLGKSLGEGNDSPLQYYCLENHMDRGA